MPVTRYLIKIVLYSDIIYYNNYDITSIIMLHDSLISSQTTFHWGERPLLGTLPGRAGATFGPCSVPGLLLLVYLFNCCVVLVVQSPFPVLDIISIVEVEFDPIDPSRDRFGFQIPDWIVGQIEGMLL